MKQLKFFTNHAETLKATQSELAKRGIAPNHLHIFIKDNTQHRYDGLVLQSEKERDKNTLRAKLVVFVLISFVAVIALFNQWISFLGFALILGVYSLLPFLLKGFFTSSCVKRETLRKVYFLVVDVDEEERDLVERIAKNHPDLVAQ